MIRGSTFAMGTALAAAAAAHVVVVHGIGARAPVDLSGQTGAAEIRLGTGFEDLVAGTLSAPPSAEVIAATRPTYADQRVQPLTTTDDVSANVAPVLPTPSVPPEPILETAEHARRASPTDPALAMAPPPLDRLVAQPAETTAISRSIHPQRRSAAFEARHAPAPRRDVSRAPAPSTTGNAERSNRAGSASGTSTAAARQAGETDTAATQAGNAAADNYPGLVMRRLSRVSPPSSSLMGATQVTFTISENGQLGAVSVTGSSGSSRLDQQAVRILHRAAPFPPPPKGARRSFAIKINAR